MAISISIKSEMDSRLVLYPLMRCLLPLGETLIVTSNRLVSRLIDGEYNGMIRTFHILVDVEGATDEALRDAGLSPEQFNFVIYDNVGVVEQDKLVIPIGPVVSSSFETEMMYLGEDRNTHIMKFGKPYPQYKKLQSKSKPKLPLKKEKKVDKTSDLTDEELDYQAKMKFKPEKEDVADKLKKIPNMEFIKIEDIEFFESTKIFPLVNKNFIKFFYTILQKDINISEPNYMREVSRKDESSGSFDVRKSEWEDDLEYVDE